MERHFNRLWLSVLGQWKPDPVTGWDGMHDDRQSPYKGYWGELGHSLKNVFVEQFRLWGWLD